MRRAALPARLALAALIAGSAPSWAQRPRGAGAAGLPPSSLRVRADTGWVAWWESRTAPVVWTRDTTLASRIPWHDEKNGVQWGELLLAGDGEAWRTRLVAVRLDPRRVRLELDTAFLDLRPAWRTERMSQDRFADVVLAVNAGQFIQTLPRGWVVLDGRQYLRRMQAALLTALVVDSGGSVHWRHGDSRGPEVAHVAWAFQSYPTLLDSGRVPRSLRIAHRGVDLGHRDARIAIGQLDSGELLVAMTRFDGLGESFGAVPFGLTTPEMAAVMGALGARDAVMLDGGISAQLMLRDRDGVAHSWRGLRAVPLALIARRR